jgi:hypothetical protein
MGKLKVNRLHKYPLYCPLFVIAIAAIQINVFANGYEFVSGFLHIDFDPWRYDSVYWGSLIFAMLYLLAIPRNRPSFATYVTASILKLGVNFNSTAKHATMIGTAGLILSLNQDINCP